MESEKGLFLMLHGDGQQVHTTYHMVRIYLLFFKVDADMIFEVVSSHGVKKKKCRVI